MEYFRFLGFFPYLYINKNPKHASEVFEHSKQVAIDLKIERRF